MNKTILHNTRRDLRIVQTGDDRFEVHHRGLVHVADSLTGAFNALDDLAAGRTPDPSERHRTGLTIEQRWTRPCPR